MCRERIALANGKLSRTESPEYVAATDGFIYDSAQLYTLEIVVYILHLLLRMQRQAIRVPSENRVLRKCYNHVVM
jgi:hypothetical protein